MGRAVAAVGVDVIMAEGGNGVARVAVAADGAGIGGKAAFRAGRRSHDGLIAMTQSGDDFLRDGIITARAVLAGGQTGLGAGCRDSGVGDHVMTKGGDDFLRDGIITARAVFAGGQAALGAGCRDSGVCNDVMTERGNLLIGCVVAAAAGLIGVPADCRAGRGLRGVFHVVMTEGRNRLRVGVAAGAGVGHDARRCTGRGCRDFACVLVNMDVQLGGIRGNLRGRDVLLIQADRIRAVVRRREGIRIVAQIFDLLGSASLCGHYRAAVGAVNGADRPRAGVAGRGGTGDAVSADAEVVVSGFEAPGAADGRVVLQRVDRSGVDRQVGVVVALGNGGTADRGAALLDRVSGASGGDDDFITGCQLGGRRDEAEFLVRRAVRGAGIQRIVGHTPTRRVAFTGSVDRGRSVRSFRHLVGDPADEGVIGAVDADVVAAREFDGVTVHTFHGGRNVAVYEGDRPCAERLRVAVAADVAGVGELISVQRVRVGAGACLHVAADGTGLAVCAVIV